MHGNSGVGEYCTLPKQHSKNYEEWVESVILVKKSTETSAHTPVFEGSLGDPLATALWIKNDSLKEFVSGICTCLVRSSGLSGSHNIAQSKPQQQTGGCEPALAWTATDCHLGQGYFWPPGHIQIQEMT